MTTQTDGEQGGGYDIERTSNGKFAKGNKGGPGRPRKRPLREVVTFEAERELWERHLELAQNDAPAREFLLKQVNGNPYQSAPELPPIAWPTITCVEDLTGAVNALLGAHASGDVGAEGLGWMVDLIVKLAKVFETVEMGPKLRKLEEHIAAMGAATGSLQRA